MGFRVAIFSPSRLNDSVKVRWIENPFLCRTSWTVLFDRRRKIAMRVTQWLDSFETNIHFSPPPPASLPNSAKKQKKKKRRKIDALIDLSDFFLEIKKAQKTEFARELRFHNSFSSRASNRIRADLGRVAQSLARRRHRLRVEFDCRTSLIAIKKNIEEKTKTPRSLLWRVRYDLYTPRYRFTHLHGHMSPGTFAIVPLAIKHKHLHLCTWGIAKR